MTDPFIDALHDRLKIASGTSTAGSEPERQRDAALTRWWEEFVDLLGQKVGAWNERQAPKRPVNFTKQASGAAHVWHPSAEATFSRGHDAIRVCTRWGAEPRLDVIIALRIASNGDVVALVNDDELGTAAAAAEHALTPVLMETFANA